MDADWDGWMKAMSASYGKAWELAAEGKMAEASEELKSNYYQELKTLYGSASQVYPIRFEKVDDWCSWSEDLVRNSLKAIKALTLEELTQEQKIGSLYAVRAHFVPMHEEAERLGKNDVIFKMRAETLKEAPSAEKLTALVAKLDDASSTLSAKEDPKAYVAAEAEWKAAVEPLLDDEEVEPDEIEPLRNATKEFYRAWGIQFE